MSVEVASETYLKDLTLPYKEGLIGDILSFLENDINTENATGNEERIAKLFCRTIESLNQEIIPKEDLKMAIL